MADNICSPAFLVLNLGPQPSALCAQPSACDTLTSDGASVTASLSRRTDGGAARHQGLLVGPRRPPGAGENPRRAGPPLASAGGGLEVCVGRERGPEDTGEVRVDEFGGPLVGEGANRTRGILTDP